MQRDTDCYTAVMDDLEDLSVVKIPISLQLEVMPLEWVLKSLFGPSLKEAGKFLEEFVRMNLERILEKYKAKIDNPNDGKSINFRVAREVFSNGCYTDNQLSAEYLSGLLVSSRSDDGKDDSMIYYLDIIKSLSSHQLMLHYLIYAAINELLVAHPDKMINLGQGNEMSKLKLHISYFELTSNKIDSTQDLTALYSKGLIKQWDVNPKEIQFIADSKITPSTLGFLLYGAGNGKSADWNKIHKSNLGNFPDVKKLKNRSFDKENLKNK